MELDSLANLLNEFAEQFIAVASASVSTNFVASPYSVWLSLSWILSGIAENAHQKFIEHTFQDFFACNDDLMSSFEELIKQVSLEICFHDAYFDSLLPLKEKFRDLAQRVYRTEYHTLPAEVSDACDVVNTCVRTNMSHGKLLSLVDTPSMGARCCSAHINTVHLHPDGPLLTPTRSDIFFEIDKADYFSVPVFAVEGEFQILDDSKATYVLLPSFDQKLSLLIAFPSAFDKEVWNALKARELRFPDMSSVTATRTQVVLPYFSVQHHTKLSAVLQGMSLRSMLKSAEFGEAWDWSTYAPSIRNMSHICSVEVNEAFLSSCDSSEIPNALHVNRSFVFSICSNSTKTVLYSGHIANPALAPFTGHLHLCAATTQLFSTQQTSVNQEEPSVDNSELEHTPTPSVPFDVQLNQHLKPEETEQAAAEQFIGQQTIHAYVITAVDCARRIMSQDERIILFIQDVVLAKFGDSLPPPLYRLRFADMCSFGGVRRVHMKFPPSDDFVYDKAETEEAPSKKTLSCTYSGVKQLYAAFDRTDEFARKFSLPRKLITKAVNAHLVRLVGKLKMQHELEQFDKTNTAAQEA